MSRVWVDDHKKPPRRGPDTRDRRWIMRCDRLGCPTRAGEPSREQPPLEQFRDAGWFLAETHGDRCPTCLASGHLPTAKRHALMEIPYA